MKQRKTIGVCLTGYDAELESKIMLGIYNKSNELDVNVLVFCNLMKKPELNNSTILSDSVVCGELEIFNVMNYDMLDGIIMLGDSFLDRNVVYKILNQAEKRHIPVINVNDDRPICNKIILSDKNAMEAVVDHLIDVHHLNRINFISGFKNNPQSEERLAAYEKSLRYHGIPFDADRVGYGEFWKKAYDVTKEFMQAEEKPQAIVCANDTMAMFSLKCVQEMGYKVPEDIIITGFDAIKDSQQYYPALTTIQKAFEDSGVKAVELIMQMIARKPVAETTEVESVLILNQSCGCKPLNGNQFYDFFEAKNNELNLYQQFQRDLMDLNNSFTNIKNPSEMFDSLNHGCDFFGIDKVYVCICNNVMNTKSDIDRKNVRQGFMGISNTMVSMFQRGHAVPPGTEFNLDRLLPDISLNGKKAIFKFFCPLYFNNKCMGYISAEPQKIIGAGALFQSWLMTISNDAGTFLLNNVLEFVVDELDNLYIRDSLTGLYNRRGFNRMGFLLLENAKENRKPVMSLCADIDNLKLINDTYGHDAGDNAIVQVAMALHDAAPHNSVCTRTGGDEFSVLVSDLSTSECERYISKVNYLLNQYNSDSGLPYKVEASYGFCSVEAITVTNLDDLVKISDENMYKVKARKKSSR